MESTQKKKPKKGCLIAIAVFAGIVLLSLIFGGDDKKSEKESSESDSALNVVKQKDELPENTTRWEYTEDINKMDDTRSYFAYCEANEIMEFDFPYHGGTRTWMIIRNISGKNSVVFRISKGQFMETILGGTINVRFDDNPATSYSFSGQSDNNPEYIHLNNPSGFINKVKQSKQVLIQCDFYNEGTRTLTFNTEGFEWNH